jgi:hypothetical protein
MMNWRVLYVMVTFKAVNIQKWPLTLMGNIVVPLGEDWHTTTTTTITGLLMCLVGSRFSCLPNWKPSTGGSEESPGQIQ